MTLVTREEFLAAYGNAHRVRREQGDIVRPLLVGEDNPYSARADDALLPFPSRSAGARLCTEILGLSIVDYLAKFDRVNLCGQKWDLATARATASRIAAASTAPRVLVLLGAKVAQAWNMLAPVFAVERVGLATFVRLPHPSGRSREWNSPGAHLKARAVLREAGVDLNGR